MKKTILFSLILLLVFTNCSNNEDDILWDFINYGVVFSITDKSGNDLLNSETKGNILENDIKVEYKKETFNIQIESAETRYNMPRKLGLRLEKDCNIEDKNVLTFGEFRPQSNYKGETFIINWGDGTKDIIKFDLFITWKKGDPTVHKKIYLNNKEYSKESFIIKLTK